MEANNVIGIYLTDICNYKCVFCSVDVPSKTDESIMKDDIYKILKENMNSKYKTIALWGGEPTLRKDFMKIISKIKENNYENIIVETNASMIADVTFANRSIELGVNCFIISIHGADAEMQDDISLVKGSYNKIITAITNIKEKGVYVRTNTVINKQNYEQIPAIVKLLIDLKVDHINLSGLRLVGSAARNLKEVTPKFTDVVRYLKEAFEIAIQSNTYITYDVIPACIMNGYEERQLKWAGFKMFYKDKSINDFSLFINSLKYKGVNCMKCKNLYQCGGVFRGYIDLYGWSEFGYEMIS
ncbi:MAG: radical SAM protein [Lachnospiraceae bacterium]|nr:radical SAM protein [Lachnospiraceae bacterium]